MTHAQEPRAETYKKKDRQMLESSEMKVLRKIVGKTKNRWNKSQQMRESGGIQPITEWQERRRRTREWDEHVTRKDAEISVENSRDNNEWMERRRRDLYEHLKISRDNLPAGRRSPGCTKRSRAT